MDDFKVKIYVANNPKDSAGERVFHFPIIPRIGDYIDVTYKLDAKNHPLVSHSGVFLVKRVLIKEVGSSFDAILHVEGDEEVE